MTTVKKILFVGVAYYPNVGYGGPIRVMRNYGLGLTKLGYDVTIFCSNLINRQHEKLTNYTVDTSREDMRVVYMNTLFRLSDGLTISLDLLRYLRQEIASYDVIHLFGVRNFFVGMTALYAQKNNIPYIIHPMGSIGYANSKVAMKFLWDQVIGKRLITKAKYVVESTNEQIKNLRACNISDEKIAILPWSPDPDLDNQSTPMGIFRKKHGIQCDAKIILFIGRIHRKKRLDLVIEALSQLKDSNTLLVVIGHDDDGTMRSLKKLVSKLNLDQRVLWAGPIHSPESATAYKDADIFVLVSEHESAPMALLEACSMGLPVIISNNTGMSELIHQRAGLVVEMTPESVLNGINKLLNDFQLCQRYSVGGQRVITQEFSMEAVCSKLENLYD